MKSNILQRLILTLTLCLVGVITSWADDNIYTRDGIIYTLDETNLTASVTGHEEGITMANIRSNVGGCTVTDIGEKAFMNCTSLTSVTIPNSVKNIEREAFRACTSLTSINLPDNLEELGLAVFYECSSLKSVKLPLSLKYILDMPFAGCTSLTSVEIPDSVVYIGDSAFDGCSSLKSVKLSNSLKAFGINTFGGCISLESIHLPASLEKLYSSLFDLDITYNYEGISAMSPFDGCESLSCITISPENKRFASDGKSIYSKDMTKVYLVNPTLKKYDLLESVTTIKKGAFYGFSDITLDIPTTVTNIEGNAFDSSRNLTIILRHSDITLGSFAFSGYKLRIICLPKSNVLNVHISTNDNSVDGIWYRPSDVVFKGSFYAQGFHELSADFMNLLSLQEDINSFISNKKTLYSNVDKDLRKELEDILKQSYDYNSLLSLWDWDQESQLAFLKTNLTKAFNNVRSAIYYQIDQNNDLSELYKRSEVVIADTRISDNKALGFPYADFDVAFNQAKKEINGECATQETIDKLQSVLNVINNATKVDFAKSEYLTLYSNKALVVPEGMKAAVVVAQGDYIRNDYRYGSGATIPAHTGVLLKGKNDYLGYLLEGSSTDNAPADNLLHGTLNDEMTNVDGAGKYYKLSFDKETKSVIGFYWGTTDGAAFINKAGKAFLAIPATLNVQQLQGFSLIDMDRTDAVTGIDNNVTSTPAPLNMFNLNGRRVEAKSIEDLQPGIYVVNGKKMYVK